MSLARSLAAVLLIASASLACAQPQDEAILLVAHPAFRDVEYRQTVLLASPAPNGGHVGVIINRPTKRSLGSLFPEHEPSKKVVDPVYYGGPFSRGALVALVRADQTPGSGSVLLMRNLYMTFRANTIDHVIETTPNEARYFVGYVGWRPGELRGEIDRGLWSVLDADVDMVFRKGHRRSLGRAAAADPPHSGRRRGGRECPGRRTLATRSKPDRPPLSR
jgi:putative transcriptional regulator